MSDKKLKQRLADLAESFVTNVLDVLSHASLSDLTAAGGAGRGPRAVVAPGPVAKRKPGRPPKNAAAPAAPVKKSAKAGLKRRRPEEIQGIRGSILGALAKSGETPLGAKQIAKEIGGAVSSNDLSFPMNKLRSEGLVEKHGDRAQTTYTLTDAGRAELERGGASGGDEKPAAKKPGRKKKAA